MPVDAREIDRASRRYAGSRWRDANGHIFTVVSVVAVPDGDAGVFDDEVKLVGVSSACDKPPICNRDHDGPYEQIVEISGLPRGRIFGWERIDVPAARLRSTRL